MIILPLTILRLKKLFGLALTFLSLCSQEAESGSNQELYQPRTCPGTALIKADEKKKQKIVQDLRKARAENRLSNRPENGKVTEL